MIERQYGIAPSLSSVWRSLRKQGLVEYTPTKKPKLYLQRPKAEMSNETWQSDLTHWRLAYGIDFEILNFLDDHSRSLLGCWAFLFASGRNVVDVFLELVAEFHAPQSKLTDNGRVFTARFGNGSTPFKFKLQDFGIMQKNSSPSHPQTQGKIERFQQTLKLHLVQNQGQHLLRCCNSI